MSQDVNETERDAENQDSESAPSSARESEAAAQDEAAASGDPSEGGDGVDSEVDPLEAAQEESKRLRDQLLRTAADFDNFRKRSRRESGEAIERAREELLKELLPVFDNLERAAEHAQNAKDIAALSDGIQLVMKQFMDTVSKLGVEKLEATGQVFDPAVHEAIQQLETSEVPPGNVASQVQAGYKIGGRLLRPCMVVVAKAPSGG